MWVVLASSSLPCSVRHSQRRSNTSLTSSPSKRACPAPSLHPDSHLECGGRHKLPSPTAGTAKTVSFSMFLKSSRSCRLCTIPCHAHVRVSERCVHTAPYPKPSARKREYRRTFGLLRSPPDREHDDMGGPDGVQHLEGDFDHEERRQATPPDQYGPAFWGDEE
jgi:hypothetical protein